MFSMIVSVISCILVGPFQSSLKICRYVFVAGALSIRFTTLYALFPRSQPRSMAVKPFDRHLCCKGYECHKNAHMIPRGIRFEPRLRADPVHTFLRKRTLRHFVTKPALEFGTVEARFTRYPWDVELAFLFLGFSLTKVGAMKMKRNSSINSSCFLSS